MYDLSKIHKPLISNFPKLPPTLSDITATYDSAAFFVPLIKYFTMNVYTFEELFEFANIISSNCYMVSLDVDSSLMSLFIKLLKSVLTRYLNLKRPFLALTRRKCLKCFQCFCFQCFPNNAFVQ